MPDAGNFGEWDIGLKRQLTEKAKVDQDCIKCPTCSSQWFVQVIVSKFVDSHQVMLGQDVPKVNNKQGYVLLKCIRCDDLLEPRVSTYARDYASDGYSELVEVLRNIDKEAKGD